VEKLAHVQQETAHVQQETAHKKFCHSRCSSTSTDVPDEASLLQEQQKQKNRKTRIRGKAAVQLPADEWTTICFRNVPNTYSSENVMELLDANGFKDSYNFIYVPHDFRRLPLLANLGYFFANFVTHDVALRALDRFDGFKEWGTEWQLESHKVLAPVWASRTQGLQACAESYQRSPVMHQDVPIECKPLMIEHGKAHQLMAGKGVRQPRCKIQTHFDNNSHGHATASCYGHLTTDALEQA